MVSRWVVVAVLMWAFTAASAAPPQTSASPLAIAFCDLLKDSKKHDGELIAVRGLMLSNGIDALAIADPKCEPGGAIRIGDAEETADSQNLGKLFDTVQLAYRSSTSSFRVAVEVTLTGTFHASGAADVRPEITPRDMNSMRLVKGVSLVPAPPAPGRK